MSCAKKIVTFVQFRKSFTYILFWRYFVYLYKQSNWSGFDVKKSHLLPLLGKYRVDSYQSFFINRRGNEYFFQEQARMNKTKLLKSCSKNLEFHEMFTVAN